LHAPLANSVYVVGDFNNWQLNNESQMHKEDDSGLWSKKLRLRQGLYQYRFVVDGRWIDDPSNPRTIENPFGDKNSVIEIK